MPAVTIQLRGRTLKVELPGAPGAPAVVDGAPVLVHLGQPQPGTLSLLHTLPDGTIRSYTALLDRTPDGDVLVIDGERIPFALDDPRSLRGRAPAASDTGAKPLKAPMPGRILRVLVALGDKVEAGQPCLVIEAMKMQNELKAPRAGTVQRLSVSPGDTVTAGHILLVVA